jgi:Zn-dependent protease with chaperone function
MVADGPGDGGAGCSDKIAALRLERTASSPEVTRAVQQRGDARKGGWFSSTQQSGIMRSLRLVPIDQPNRSRCSVAAREPSRLRNRSVLRCVPNVMKRVLWLMALSRLLAYAQPVYTADKELAVGKQLAAELERNVAVINDPAITAYVNRVAGKLAETAKLLTPLTIKVISGSNAYATIQPGGFLDVDSTLILDAVSEAELAGVIAHQIGHLAVWQASNYEQQIGYLALWQAYTNGTIPLTFMGGGLCVRCGLHSFCGVGIPIGSLATSRDREAKADELALGYMQSAGYDPDGLVDFYDRMPKPQRGTLSQVFDPGLTMPESTREAAASMRNAHIFIVTSSEFEGIQQRVAALLPKAVPRTRVPSLSRDGQ